jgi:AraC-like DNA-binding protein
MGSVPKSVSSVQAWVLPHVIAWVERRGADASSLRPLLSDVDSGDPDVRVPDTVAESVWRTAAVLTGDLAIGVHVAQSLPRGALDLVEYAFRSSPSLAAGLERLTRYGRVLSDRVASRMEGDGDALTIEIRDVGGTALHSGRAEFGLAVALKLSRDAIDAPLVPREVRFAHAAPADITEHERFFACPIRFGAGTNAMIISGADAMRRLVSADPALADIVRRRLDKVLAERVVPAAAAPVNVRVRRMLLDDFAQATLTPDAVAKSLAMSHRTLSRRLAEEGTTFRQILDHVRAELARVLLDDASLSVADVAFFLQYSEPAAFHRSFKRWTGKTPTEYRDRAV